jgi:hypothetical protein
MFTNFPRFADVDILQFGLVSDDEIVASAGVAAIDREKL